MCDLGYNTGLQGALRVYLNHVPRQQVSTDTSKTNNEATDSCAQMPMAHDASLDTRDFIFNHYE